MYCVLHNMFNYHFPFAAFHKYINNNYRAKKQDLVEEI